MATSRRPGAARTPTAAPLSHAWKWTKRIAQVVVIGAALLFLARTASRNWDQLGDVSFDVRWLPLLAGSAITLLTYAYNVALWTWSLRWWEQRLPFLPALRIWFLSNLARFIPGVVWQFAGLASMSHARGVSPLAAAGGVLLQQLALLLTGALLSLALAPELLSVWAEALPATSGTGRFAARTGEWAHALPVALRLALGVAAFLVASALLPAIGPPVSRLFQRLTGRSVRLPAPPLREAATYLAANFVPWLAYGAGFWLFGIGLLGDAAPGLVTATAAFVVSYVAGIVVVVAPAGLGVREVVLYALLRPAVGDEAALVLSLVSRVWLIATEITGALVVMALTRDGEGTPRASGATRA